MLNVRSKRFVFITGPQGEPYQTSYSLWKENQTCCQTHFLRFHSNVFLKISKINHFPELSHLKHLNLSQNAISHIDRLDFISDKMLDLGFKSWISELLLINYRVWDSWVWVTIVWRNWRRNFCSRSLIWRHYSWTTTTWKTSTRCSLDLATSSISALVTIVSSGSILPSSQNPSRQ